MMLGEQVFAQALLLAGDLDAQEADLLHALCAAATASLRVRLKKGLTPEDCKADFIAAASLYALSAMETAAGGGAEEFRAGDLTVKRSGGSAASNCLRNQAELVITPYLEDRFAFLGV